jgi:hypothetical protein
MTDLVHEKIVLPGSEKNKAKFAVVIRNALSQEECQQLIDRTEAQGYIAALVNVGGGKEVMIDDYRHSQRCIIDDFDTARMIADRVQPFIPASFRSHEYVELNERLRFLKYRAGDFFAPHCDGSYSRDNGDRSYITLMLYLSGGSEGGQTRLYSVSLKLV